MTKYKCGHESKVIFLKTGLLSLSAYITWKEDDGKNKKRCFKCWCKEHDRKIKEFQDRQEKELKDADRTAIYTKRYKVK